MSIFFSLVLLSCSSSSEEGSFSARTSPLPICENPINGLGFEKRSPAQSNISFVHQTEVSDVDPENVEAFDSIRGTYGGGVVVADFDNDGAQDIFFVQETGSNQLYWGLGDATFSLDTTETGTSMALESEISLTANTADYNGDGWLDLLVLGYNSIHLYQNQSNRQFTDVTDEVGLVAANGYLGGTSWGDYDQDGDLDLFVGSYGIPTLGNGDIGDDIAVLPSQLYRNDGENFSDRSADIPFREGKEGACLQAAFRDFDDDGDLDILQVNDFGTWQGMTNIWENQGGNPDTWNWYDRFAESRLDNLVFPMGSVYRDLNADGIPDMWFSDIGRTHLLQGMGSWEWVDVGASWTQGTTDEASDVSWSVLDLDLDGDGMVEIYINYGPHMAGEPDEEWADDEEYEADQPDRFWVNTALENQPPRFQNRADLFPEDLIGNARGASSMDINQDAVPDLVIGNLGSAPSILLGKCTEAKRLIIHLRDPHSNNHYAIGAKVTIETDTHTQTQELSAGGRGSFSGEAPILLFGLADAEKVNQITIRWPNGEMGSMKNLCSHCEITLERNSPVKK